MCIRDPQPRPAAICPVLKAPALASACGRLSRKGFSCGAMQYRVPRTGSFNI